MEHRYSTLKEFYPYYLLEHNNPTSRSLHFIGTSLFLCILFYGLITVNWRILIIGPILGYGFAWIGHFFFEKNKPATFKYPLFSLASDFIMLYHFLSGQLPKRMADARIKMGHN